MKKFLLPLVVVFSLAIPAIAQAHTVTLTVACGKATIYWANFTPGGTSAGNDNNGGKNTPSWAFTFQAATGGAVQSYSGTASFTTASYTLVVPITPAVDGTILQASSSWTSAQTTDKVSGGDSGSDFPVTGCPTTTTTTTSTSKTTTPTTSTTTTTSSTTSSTTTPSTTTTTSSTTTPTTSTTSTTPSTTTTATTNITTTNTTPVTSTTATTTSTTSTPTGSGGVLGSTTCVATKVTLSKTKIASNKHFTAVVRGSGIKSVVFYIDGRKVKTLTKANSGTEGFAYTVPVSSGRYGTHTLTTKTTTKCGSPKTNGLDYSRVAPAKAVVPKFTG